MLVDIVSRNGNLLLNFPLPGSGEPDSRELAILSEITTWMAVNGEGIYGTRPWKMFGEGPATAQKGEGQFNENGRKALSPQDIRYTTKGKTLYAFIMGWPGAQAVVPAATDSVVHARNVELLGHKGKLKWSQDANGLSVALPIEKPSEHAVALKITLA
jgi:alpha-L-fucosidase